MGTGLVLAGHGSHISPETAGLVWRTVDRLRAQGIADEVTAAFWKEQPSFHDVLRTLDARQVIVVPLFTTRGFFTQQVIPAEMSLAGPVTIRDGRTIHYTRTLSETPTLAQVVQRRIVDTLAAHPIDPQQCGIVIIGHSTRRNVESRRATEAQAEAVRAIGLVSEVIAVYLDDEPPIQAMYSLTSAPILIAVPYFLAAGSHVTIDVPRAIGLPDGAAEAQINGRQVWYTDPVGSEAELVEAIRTLAEGTGLLHQKLGEDGAWAAFPTVGRDALYQSIQALPTGGRAVFGDLTITLTHIYTAVEPSSEPPNIELRAALEPPTLRAAARITDERFRPLAAERGLHLPWAIPYEGSAMLHGIIETIYPGAVADWALSHRGAFPVQSLDQTVDRQVGQFKRLVTLSDVATQSVTQSICGKCTRHPTWHDGLTTPIPCAEPCNIWLSEAFQGVENHDSDE